MAPPRERLRKHKFTDAELDILVKEVTRHEDTLFGLQGNRLTAREKYKIWFGITEQVCAASGLQRSIEDVKRRWQDLRRRTKTRVLEARRQMCRDRPASSLCLSSVDRRVFDSRNVHSAVKHEEQNAAVCHLPEDFFLDAGAESLETYPQVVEKPPASVKDVPAEEPSFAAVLGAPDTQQNQPSISCPEVMVKNEVYCQYPSEERVEVTEGGGSATHCSELTPYPGLRAPQKAVGVACHRRAPLSPFEQQLLQAHREHTAALREGFRLLARQNRLLYRELCETNRNVACVASRIAERSESVCDVADELMGVHHKISESIEATNCLHDRVVELLAAQQERPLGILPRPQTDSQPGSSAVEEASL
ncbi:uncharacterized protein LOC125739460 isoform X1 [Brienomyrus brachyistius]|uniref:uncharacterized protein LOC125739460 isoform X1 n=1 Tax=Brienomyrus brachyistius TaxID=42636 RepID=UPI0020B31831|nr:uncharacterized protein LOC125739460 isoform X1 [Brienomyrus brachyistius]